MPATDQTWYPMKLLHRLFAVASLALLATTVWLLAKDHQRPWKEYQRTANRIEGRTAAWRQYQLQADQEQDSAAGRADLMQLEAAAERETKYFHFEHGIPWPGKRLLELPILDAFNSPLRIENLWAEGLTQDFNFRQVPRFDRCTTCHTAMQKTEPGSATAPAFPPEQRLEFTLSPAAVSDRPRLTATQRGARNAASTAAPPPISPPPNAPSPDGSLDQRLGLLLANQGLLNPRDVTVCYVRPGTPAATAVLVTPPQAARSAEQILRDQFQTGDAAPVPRVAPGLRAGDVLVAINGVPVEDREQAIAQLLAVATAPPPPVAADDEAEDDDDDNESSGSASATPSLVLTVRRGLPHPFASHPRLDLFVGELSPHKMSDFACTVCHEGQGSATEFKWASHSPNDLADRQRWRDQHDWFDNPFWDFPMAPQRFIESTCPKCHHRVVDLQPSQRFPQPPAPKLLRGYTLVRTYGCYGCHEINGFQDGKRIGPDLRTEPLTAASGQTDALQPPGASRDADKPGRQRPPGPSLRYLDRGWTDAFLHDWLQDPRRFRPATRMPRVFGLWNHLEGPSRELAQRYEPLEIRGIVAYLRGRVQDPGPAAAPAGITAGTVAESAERGRVLFQTRGCLACHTHAAFADADSFRDPDELLAGPDLSNIAGKLDAESGRVWLTEFIRQPVRHLPRTIMPDLLLEPIQNRDAEGQVLSVTDPAEDIAQFLLQQSVDRADAGLQDPDTSFNGKPQASADPARSRLRLAVKQGLDDSAAGYQPQVLPDVDTAALDQLILEYLRGAFHEGKASQYAQRGIPAQLADTLQAAEKELLVPGGEAPRN
jgi:cytochrome c551/c552